MRCLLIDSSIKAEMTVHSTKLMPECNPKLECVFLVSPTLFGAAPCVTSPGATSFASRHM
jgi:hypothetical protein